MVAWKNTVSSYGLMAKSFHWIIAVLILGMLMVGFYMTGLSSSPFKFSIYGWHKSFGTVVLIFAMLRLSWKFINIAPAHLPSHTMWEVTLAKIVHVLLYVVMIAMPLSGWIMSSAADFHYAFFGLFEMPKIIPKNEAIFNAAREAHSIIAYIIIGLLGLHVAGALKHHFFDKDETLQRMSSRKVGFKWGVVLTLLVAAVFLKIGYLAFFGEDPAAVQAAPVTAPVIQQGLLPSIPSGAPSNAMQATGWLLDHVNSSIKFSVTQYGTPFEGYFETFDGQIVFDPNNLSAAHAGILIDIASIKTGSEDRDNNAKGPDWFDTAHFMYADFQTNSIEAKGANQYVAHGTLKIRGVTQPIDLPFTLSFSENPKTATMDGALSLDRQAFGIGQGQWKSANVIGNTVNVTIHVVAHWADPAAAHNEKINQ